MYLYFNATQGNTMSNHPNMSYCMWTNSYQALRQVAEDFQERLENQGGQDEFEGQQEPLSLDEQRALRSTFDLMRELLDAAGVDEDCNDAGEAALVAIEPEETA